MLESAAISTKNAKPGTGRNPIDLTPDDESSSARSMKIKMIKAKVKRPLGAYLGEGTHSHIE